MSASRNVPLPTFARQARSIDHASGPRTPNDPRGVRASQQAMRSLVAGAGLSYDVDGRLVVDYPTVNVELLVAAQSPSAVAAAGEALALAGAAGHVIESQTTLVTISNTLTETALYTYTILENTLVRDRKLRLKIGGMVQNTTGGNVGFTLKVNLGSTVIWEGATGAIITSNAAQRYLDIELWLIAASSSQSQFLQGRVTVEQPTPAGTVTGVGGIAGTPLIDGHIGSNSAAVDMTAEQVLTVTITPTSMSPLHLYEMRAGFIVLY